MGWGWCRLVFELSLGVGGGESEVILASIAAEDGDKEVRRQELVDVPVDTTAGDSTRGLQEEKEEEVLFRSLGLVHLDWNSRALRPRAICTTILPAPSFRHSVAHAPIARRSPGRGSGQS